MINDKTRAEMDQATSTLAEFLPPLWHQLYGGLLKEEFDERQSMELLKCYILSQGTASIKP